MAIYRNSENQPFGDSTESHLVSLASGSVNYWFSFVSDPLTVLFFLFWETIVLRSSILLLNLTFGAGLLSWSLLEYAFHRWVYHKGQTAAHVGHKKHHETPEALIAVAVGDRYAYALGYFGHVLFQFDTATRDVKRIPVGSVGGHVSRNFIADYRGHAFVPRLRVDAEPLGRRSARVSIVELGSNLEARSPGTRHLFSLVTCHLLRTCSVPRRRE